ncbi:MAG TPA: histidinol-phosphate transaminase [Gaiellales bacterium]|jgi:histidinol-phosphate aminotransferase
MAPRGRVDWAQLARPSLAGIEPYDPGESRDELKERHGLSDLAPLNWNEDLFGPPQHVLDAAVAEVARAPLYPERAYSDFRAAVAEWIGVPAACVVPAHGAQALIGAVASVFVDPDTAVVIPQPTYGLYAQICAAGGAIVTHVPADGLRFDLGAIAAAARAQSARMVWLCDPNNPTGLLIGRDEWSEFLARLPERCVAVVDEAYGDFSDPEVRARREQDVLDGRPVIVIRSFSKVFGLAGLRLGYAVCDPAVATLLNVVQEPFNVNRVALAAGRAAVATPDFVLRRRAEVAAARQAFADALAPAGIEVIPSQANFVLVRLGVADGPVCDRLLRKGLLIRGGESVGLPGYARVTMAPADLMRTTAREILAALRA